VTGAALRTRPRWVSSSTFGEAQPRGADGSQQEPVPVPDQLRAEFTEAFWRSMAWRDTTWLGRRVHRAPTDLIAYQELIASLRPDWIVEVRTAGGARALYLASICELVGSGRVLAIQARRRGVLPEHPRITYLTGPPSGEEMRSRVFETVGEGAKALVVIAPANRKVVLDEFEAYASLVPVGSFVIVENTVLNGHPVQPTYGPGPAEAVEVILKQRGDFVPDHRLERFGFSFNPRGFLRRVE
jgi:cephalosporin hydroxylase